MDGTPREKGAALLDHGEAPRRIDPMFNSVFLRVFGEEGSKDITRNLVNAILGRAGIEPIGEVERISADASSQFGTVECKAPRVDVKIVADGRIVDLEAQNKPEDIDARSALYAAQLLAAGTPKGAGYDEVPQVVVITLLNAAPVFPGTDELVTVCRMRWQTPAGRYVADGTDRALFVLVELEKARRRYNVGPGRGLSVPDEAEAWAYLLALGWEDDEEVGLMANRFPTLEEFAERYGRAVGDPDTVRAYDAYESAEREHRSMQRYLARVQREALEEGMEHGRQEGLEQGLEQGLAQGFDRLAGALRAAGVDESVLQLALAQASARE